LSQTLNLADFSVILPRHVDCRKCCQLSSTNNYRQFVTVSIHLCLQHCVHDAQCHRVCLGQLRLVLTTYFTHDSAWCLYHVVCKIFNQWRLLFMAMHLFPKKHRVEYLVVV